MVVVLDNGPIGGGGGGATNTSSVLMINITK